MLPMTRRPSATTAGSALKSLLSSTSCAACSVACAPPAMAIEQSAAFSDGMSLTPSPVMATWCPSAFIASTKIRLRSGVRRPKITQSFAAAFSSSSLSVAQSAIRSAPSSPSARAAAATVRGSSPLMTRTETPSLRNHSSVSRALGRKLSDSSDSPKSLVTGGNFSPSITPSASANSSTRYPSFAAAIASGITVSVTNDAAPRISVFPFSNEAADFLRVEENGSTAVARRPLS